MTEHTPEQEAGGTDWAWLAQDAEEARRDQWQAYTAQALVYSQRMATGWDAMSDWSYRAPASDDWSEWTGVAKWCALSVRYAAVERARDALVLGGPYRCGSCDSDLKLANWEHCAYRTCVDCWWVDSGYDAALDMARQIGRQWKQEKVAA
jgi:hypothetical protein